VVCEAIESAISQRVSATGADRRRDSLVEVIVIDDGSTDDTAGIVRKNFGSRVHFVRTPSRRGPGAARNKGVRIATGELLAFLDSDDVWLPGKLDAELSVLKGFPGAEAVVSDSVSVLEGVADERSRFDLNGLRDATTGQPCWLHECSWLWTNLQNNMATCSITLDSKGVGRFNGPLFAEDLIYCEDWEFELRVHSMCKVVVLPEVLARVRRFDDGTRPGRACPGKPLTAEQMVCLLRDRLKVMERADWASGLAADLAAELDRSRLDTVRELEHILRG